MLVLVLVLVLVLRSRLDGARLWFYSATYLTSAGTNTRAGAADVRR